MDDQELVVPFCGGCGHLYFKEDKIPYAEAKKQAETRRCHYCHEDERLDEDRRRKGDRDRPEPDQHYWIYPEW